LQYCPRGHGDAGIVLGRGHLGHGHSQWRFGFNRASAIVAIQWMDINGHYEVGINNALKDVRALEQDSTVE